MEITYALIQPIIVSSVLEGQQMRVEFKASNQETAIKSVGMLTVDQAEMMSGMKKNMVKQSAISIVLGTISSFVMRMFGQGTGGMVASSAVSSASTMAAMSMQSNSMAGMMQAKDTPKTREAAVLMAFQSVQSMYEWDATASIWVYKPTDIPKAPPATPVTSTPEVPVEPVAPVTPEVPPVQ